VFCDEHDGDSVQYYVVIGNIYIAKKYFSSTMIFSFLATLFYRFNPFLQGNNMFVLDRSSSSQQAKEMLCKKFFLPADFFTSFCGFAISSNTHRFW
jgi:hypothetical protein